MRWLLVVLLALPTTALAGEVVLGWENGSSNYQVIRLGACIVPGGVHPTDEDCDDNLGSGGGAGAFAWDATHTKVGGLQPGTRHCFQVTVANTLNATYAQPSYICADVPPLTLPSRPTNFRVLAPHEPIP